MQVKRFMLSDKINLPKDIVISKVKDKYVVVAPKKGTYLVIDDIQLQLLHYLKEKHTLIELIKSNHYKRKYYGKLQDLLVQISFRKFYENYQPNKQPYTFAHILLTNACNLRCILCYRFAGTKKKGELSVNKWKEVLNTLLEQGVKSVSFDGGEPFLFEGIYDLIKYAVKIGMEVVVLSNGTQIDFNKSLTLKKLKEIVISLNGPTEEINDSMRGAGVFSKVMANLHKLNDLGINVSISIFFFEKFIEEYKFSLEKFLLQLRNKYPSLTVRPYTELLPGRKIDTTENEKLNIIIKDIFKKVYGLKWLIEYDCALFHGFRMNCGYASCIVIDCTGDILACSASDEIIGNICSDKIPDIISRLKYLNTKYGVENVDPCYKCELRYICGGKCRVMSKHLYGSMSKNRCSEEYKKSLYATITEGYHQLYSVGGEK